MAANVEEDRNVSRRSEVSGVAAFKCNDAVLLLAEYEKIKLQLYPCLTYL